MGFGVSVNHCNLSEKSLFSTDGMFLYEAPGFYSCKIPFVFLVHQQVYTAPSIGLYNSDKIVIKLTRSDGARQVIFDCVLVYDTYPSAVLLGQTSFKTTSSVVQTVDGDFVLKRGAITCKQVSKSDFIALNNFITEAIGFNEYKFRIEVFSREGN
jgi:hypothetical protein